VIKEIVDKKSSLRRIYDLMAIKSEQTINHWMATIINSIDDQ